MLHFQSGLFHRGIGINYSDALIAHKLCHGWSHTFIIPQTINTKTQISAIYLNPLQLFRKLPTLFVLGAPGVLLNENLINIPFPIMGSLYILSFLSFLANFCGEESKRRLLCSMNLSPKRFEKGKKGKRKRVSSSEGTVIL